MIQGIDDQDVLKQVVKSETPSKDRVVGLAQFILQDKPQSFGEKMSCRFQYRREPKTIYDYT